MSEKNKTKKQKHIAQKAKDEIPFGFNMARRKLQIDTH